MFLNFGKTEQTYKRLSFFFVETVLDCTLKLSFNRQTQCHATQGQIAHNLETEHLSRKQGDINMCKHHNNTRLCTLLVHVAPTIKNHQVSKLRRNSLLLFAQMLIEGLQFRHYIEYLISHFLSIAFIFKTEVIASTFIFKNGNIIAFHSSCMLCQFCHTF